jgi:hypothetical protein
VSSAQGMIATVLACAKGPACHASAWLSTTWQGADGSGCCGCWCAICRVLALFTKGFPTACLLANKQLVVHQKALKACHTLFDMEVRVCTVGRLCVQHGTGRSNDPSRKVLPVCLCLAVFACMVTHIKGCAYCPAACAV